MAIKGDTRSLDYSSVAVPGLESNKCKKNPLLFTI